MALKPNQLPEELKSRELEILRLMADGCTNHEIAAALMIEVTTVRWHSKQLYSKLGIHSRTLAIARARQLGLLDEAKPPSSTTHLPSLIPLIPSSNLPAQATSFVGRRREIANVRQLLSASRLVTLTGPGGTGKTRLALEVAETEREHFADGVWFVPLTALQDAALVAITIAGVLKVAEAPGESIEASLIKHLQEKQMLLVVDNFEHVVESATVLPPLLAGTTRCKVLVTSREVLRLYGEQEYPVPSLTVPDVDQFYTWQEVREFEAVRLFVERAQACQPAFEVTAENAEAVAHICRRLDGLPLALELAAARTKMLAPQQLLTRLEHGLSGLGQGPRDAPARQRTLRATLDWSFNLLSADEKRLCSRLAVFGGGWTLEAMEAVCGVDLPFALLDGLKSLMDKSLVLATEGQKGDARFRMLEVVRDYVWEQLESQEAWQIQRSHRDWFLELAEMAGKGMHSAASPMWYAQLRAEEDNLNAALDWCLDDPQGADVGLLFASNLCEYWLARGTYRRGRAWLAAFLQRTEDAKSLMRGRALASAGMLAKLEHDFEAVARLCSEAVEIARSFGDRGIEALALHFLAHVAQERTGYTESLRLYERSITLFEEIEDSWGAGETMNCLGDMQRQFGHYADAEIRLRQALLLRRLFNNRRGVCATLCNLGHVLCRRNNVRLSTTCFRESLEINQELGNQLISILCVSGFAGVAVIQGKAERAAQLLGAVDHFLAASHLTLDSPDQVDYEWIVAQSRTQAPPELFATAWAHGQGMSLAQAIAYASGSAG